jgi:hypothetical protein
MVVGLGMPNLHRPKPIPILTPLMVSLPSAIWRHCTRKRGGDERRFLTLVDFRIDVLATSN